MNQKIIYHVIFHNAREGFGSFSQFSIRKEASHNALFNMCTYRGPLKSEPRLCGC